MTIKTIDSALDFLPETGKPEPSRPLGLLAKIAAIFKAIDDGLAANQEYKRLTAHGVAPAEAARQAFDEHIEKR
jgi:hypothetical protein